MKNVFIAIINYNLRQFLLAQVSVSRPSISFRAIVSDEATLKPLWAERGEQNKERSSFAGRPFAGPLKDLWGSSVLQTLKFGIQTEL